MAEPGKLKPHFKEVTIIKSDYILDLAIECDVKSDGTV